MANSKLYTKLKKIETAVNLLLTDSNFQTEITVGKRLFDFVKSSNLTDKVFINLSQNQNFVLIENNQAFRKFMFDIVITSKFAPKDFDNLPENLFLISEKIDDYFNTNENYVVNNFSFEYNSELQSYIVFLVCECIYD